MSQDEVNPNRRCSHGNRLHVSGSLHSSSVQSEERISTMSDSSSNHHIPSSQNISERTMSPLVEGEEDQDIIGSLPEHGAQIPHQTWSLRRSQSLPQYGSEDFSNSSPPRRVSSSILNAYDSDDATILVRRTTPPFSPSDISQQQDHLPQQRSRRNEHRTNRAHLQASLLDLREELRTSTDIINNLRTRNQVHELENTAQEAELRRAEEERVIAWEKARDAAISEDYKLRILLMLLGSVLVSLGLYCYWSWYFGPEMSYVRQRRRAVLFD